MKKNKEIKKTKSKIVILNKSAYKPLIVILKDGSLWNSRIKVQKFKIKLGGINIKSVERVLAVMLMI
jgi:hypothetical protein